MVRKIPTLANNAGAMQLQAMAERLETQGELRNPIIEKALMQAARQQSQAAVETAEQAAGMTGAAQVGMAQMAQAQAMGQAMMQAQAQRVQNMQATLGLQAQLRGQVASLEEQRYQTNLQHQQFMLQMEEQAKQAKRERTAGLVGGLASMALPGISSLLAGPAAAAAAGGEAALTAGQIGAGSKVLGGLKTAVTRGFMGTEGVSSFAPMGAMQSFFMGLQGQTPQPQSSLIQQAAEAFQQRQLMGMGDFVSPLGYGLG